MKKKKAQVLQYLPWTMTPPCAVHEEVYKNNHSVIRKLRYFERKRERVFMVGERESGDVKERRINIGFKLKKKKKKRRDC